MCTNEWIGSGCACFSCHVEGPARRGVAALIKGESEDVRIFFGECGGEFGGVVVRVCVGVGVEAGMRVPVVPGASQCRTAGPIV
jgi:hypothetical protein